MKRFFSLFLVVVLVFSFIVQSFSYADVIEELNNPKLLDDTVSGSDTTGGGSVKENITDPAEQSESEDFKLLSWLAKIFFGFLGELANPNSWVLWLIYMLPTVDGIIFNVDDYFRISYFETPSTTNPSLASRIVGDISAFYNAFRYLVTACYIVILVYIGIRMMLSSIGRQKAKYKEMFKYWLIGLLMLFSFHWVMAFFVWLSNTFVDILREFTCSLLREHHTIGITDVVFNTGDNYPITSYIVSKIRGFDFPFLMVGWFLEQVFKPITILIFSYMLIKQGWNFVKVYFVRLISISILILIFPIVVLSYVFDKMGDRRAQTFETWFKEFTVNVFIQPIHALILCFVGAIYAYASDIFILHSSLLGPLFALFCLRLLPVGEDYLKRLFQIQAQTGPGSHGIAGSVAMANRTMEGFKNMATAPIKTLKGAADLRRLKQRHAGDEAKYMKSFEDDIRNGRMTREDAQRKAREAARKDYEKDRKENNIKSGRELKANAFGMLSGSSSAITGAGRGQFVSEALRKANMRSELYGGIARGIEDRPWDKLLNGDATKSEDFDRQSKGLGGLTNDEAKKLANNDAKVKQIAIDLNLKPSQVKDMLKKGKQSELAKAYTQVGNQLRWGAKLEYAKGRSDLAIKQQEFDKVNAEHMGMWQKAGFKSEDDKLYITDDGTYIMQGDNRIRVGEGNSKLKPGEEVAIPLNGKGGVSVETMAKQLAQGSAEYNESMQKCTFTDEDGKIYTGEEAVKMAQNKVSTCQANQDRTKKAWEDAGRRDTGPEFEAYKKAQGELQEAKDSLSDIKSGYKTQQDVESRYSSVLLQVDQQNVQAGGMPKFTETAATMRTDSTKYGIQNPAGYDQAVESARNASASAKSAWEAAGGLQSGSEYEAYQKSLEDLEHVQNSQERYFELQDSNGETHRYTIGFDGNTAQRQSVNKAATVADETLSRAKARYEKAQQSTIDAQTNSGYATNERITAEADYKRVQSVADNDLAQLDRYTDIIEDTITQSREKLTTIETKISEAKQVRIAQLGNGLDTTNIETDISYLESARSAELDTINTNQEIVNSYTEQKATITSKVTEAHERFTAAQARENEAEAAFNFAEQAEAWAKVDVQDPQADFDKKLAGQALDTEKAYTTAPTATMQDINNFVRSTVDTATLDQRQSDYNSALVGGDSMQIRNAKILLQQEEINVQNQVNARIGEFIADPSAVFGYGGGTDTMAAAFANTNIQNEAIGKSSMTFSSLSQAVYSNQEAFSYGICTDLTDMLSNYDSTDVIVNLERISDTTLHYTVAPNYGSRNVFAQNDIDVGSGFNNPDLSNIGDRISIICKNGTWYKA